MKSQNLSPASPLTPSPAWHPPPPPLYLNVSISMELINTSCFRCLCVPVVCFGMLGEGGGMMYWMGKWSVVLFFCFNITSESFSLCVCVWSIITPPPHSLILSLRSDSDPSLLGVCARQRLWIMQWPFPLTWPRLTQPGHHWAKQHSS